MTERPSFTGQQIENRRVQVQQHNNVKAQEAELIAALIAGLPSYAPDKAATLAALTAFVRNLARVSA
jgi:hypothetical protein